MLKANQADIERLKRYLHSSQISTEEEVEEYVRKQRAIIENYPTQELKRLLWLSKALKNNIRIKLLLLLREGKDVCFCEFVMVLGLSKSTISHHLNILEYIDLITIYSRGKWKYYGITDLGIRILNSLLT